MKPLFTFGAPRLETPHITHIYPDAAMPGGEVELHGSHLGPHQSQLPLVTLNDVATPVTFSRPTHTRIRVPEGAFPGDLIMHRAASSSNTVGLRVASLAAENLHPVANPAVDAHGNLFTTLSGARGQSVPVSVFKIDTQSPAGDFPTKPFLRDFLNPTGLAFDSDGYLYISCRADGTIYRVSSGGAVTTYAEGMGIATGIAFDREGNLFVGDRSGTIFKVTRAHTIEAREIFVFATLEPSISAYHLAFDELGTLYVTGPTTSSSQSVHAIDRDGNTTTFFSGLGRPQGLAFDIHNNLYVAASYHGRRGILRITPDREASFAISGNNLIGLAFLPGAACALATRDAIYHIDLGIDGRSLI